MRFTKNHLYIVFRFLAEFVGRAGSFITFPLLAKFLGAESYGIQTQIGAINGVLISIATMGLGFSVVRGIAGKDDVAYVSARFLSTLIIVIASSSTLIALVIILAPLLNNLFVKVVWATSVIRWSALLIVLGTLELVLTDYYRARLRIVAYSVFQILQTTATVGGVGLVLISGGGLLEVVLALVVVKAALVFSMTVYFRSAGEIRFRSPLISSLELGEMVRFGAPIIATGVSAWMMGLGDRMVIGYYLNANEVGVYGAAYTLAGILGALASPFWGPLYPLMAVHKNNNNYRELTDVCRKYTSAYCLIGIPALLGLSILSSELLQRLGSVEFFVHPFTFGAIALGLFSDQFSTNVHYLLYLHNDTKFLRNITVLCGVLNIGLNIVLVPLLGIFGAALATLASYLILDAFLFKKVMSYGYRFKDLYDMDAICRFTLSALVMAVVVHVTKSHKTVDPGALSSSVILGMACYGAMLGLLTYAPLGFLRWAREKSKG